jgi:hypothetical protein
MNMIYEIGCGARLNEKRTLCATLVASAIGRHFVITVTALLLGGIFVSGGFTPAKFAQAVPTFPEGTQSFDDVLGVLDGTDFSILQAEGLGTADSPKVITTPRQLAEIAVIVNSKGINTLAKVLFGEQEYHTDTEVYLELGNDIDLSVYGRQKDVKRTHRSHGWVPIGNDATPFRAKFDGKGHIIENLQINNRDDKYLGLFGVTLGANITNVTLRNANIRGGSFVGSLVGKATDTSLIKVFAEGIQVEGSRGVGGLLGIATAGSIESSSAQGFAGVIWGEVGGLIGETSGGQVTSSYFSGAVSSLGEGGLSYVDAAGGLIGVSHGGFIRYSYANAEVSGVGDVGGLVGKVDGGDVVDAYSTGEVLLFENIGSIGGLVGSNICGQINRTYSASTVIGSKNIESNVGGLVGKSGLEATSNRRSCSPKIANSVAVNETVTSANKNGIRYHRHAGRIVGSNNQGVLDNNRAWGHIFVPGHRPIYTDGTAFNGYTRSDRHGERVPSTVTLVRHWDSILGWTAVKHSSEVGWSFAKHRLPVLNGIPEELEDGENSAGVRAYKHVWEFLRSEEGKLS